MIFFRNNQIFFCHSFRHRPLHADLRIVKVQTALIVWMIEIGTFISKLCIIREYDKSMCKVLRNKELFLIFCRKQDAEPFSVCFGSLAKVNRNIEYFSVYHAYQFVLRVIDLEVKSTQDTFFGCRLVILYELDINAGFFKIIVIVCLHKISALIAEYGRGNYF